MAVPNKHVPKKYGLQELLDEWGVDMETMMRDSIMDGVAPAICTNCGYTTEMEPDQDRGWCESCEKNTVKSGLILAGMI